MTPVRLASASGLRPMSAFVVVGCVLVAVAARVAALAHAGGAAQPRLAAAETGFAPAYEILDRRGRVAARFVERFDLEMSPRSAWRVHTPERIARRLSEALGGEPPPEALLAAMLPGGADGVVRVEGLELGPREALAVSEWIAGGPGEPSLAGVWLERLPRDGAPLPRYRLAWRPAELLSAREREAHGVGSAARWTRRLLDGLALALHGAELPAEPSEREAALEVARASLWRLLCPPAHRRPVENVPAERVPDVRRVLAEEGVSTTQMRLVRGRERHYPLGRFEVLGSWGHVTGDEAAPRAREGLELLCDTLLARGEWPLEPPPPSEYRFEVRRSRAGGRSAYYLGYGEAGEPPRFETTLDLDLQREVRRRLEEVAREHRPALAMAIALDVESGEVLAVDSVERYEVHPFAPVFHRFTPGSTFKVLTMAIALDEGVVAPGTVFDVGHGAWPVPESSRVIREAEGALTGRITATETLAWSVNAGLAQVGMRIPDRVFFTRLSELGYRRTPGAGLGPESGGWLARPPWKPAYTHASVGFGHELHVTLWQHAAALAAVVRGGEWRPLTLLRAAEQSGRRFPIERSDGRAQRVLGEEACNRVREMMAIGAREGTGRPVWRDDIEMGTKTGTAEKVPTEVCLHVEGAAREECRRRGVPFDDAARAALRGRPKPHRSCYTSSMCVFGRVPGGREVMVLVVVEEPTGRERFGSRVAGPAAAAILARALGVPERPGEPQETAPDWVPAGFAPAALELFTDADEPWRGGGEAW